MLGACLWGAAAVAAAAAPARSQLRWPKQWSAHCDAGSASAYEQLVSLPQMTGVRLQKDHWRPGLKATAESSSKTRANGLPHQVKQQTSHLETDDPPTPVKQMYEDSCPL